MMKYLAALLATALLAVVGIASPASAATSGATCNTGNSTGSLVVVNNNGLWGATGYVGDGGNHQWFWELYKNGNRFAQGEHAGSFDTWQQSVVNSPGNDTFRFKFWSANGVITCNAYVTVS